VEPLNNTKMLTEGVRVVDKRVSRTSPESLCSEGDHHERLPRQDKWGLRCRPRAASGQREQFVMRGDTEEKTRAATISRGGVESIPETVN